jgi:hypothetical protein
MTSPEEEKDGGLPRHQVTVTVGMGVEWDAAVQADAPIPAETGVFRPEYIEALALLAQVCGEVERKGYPTPILVGGAAVEFHTGAAVVTGDFDFVTRHHEVFEEILPRYGFILEEKHSDRLMKHFRHPTLDLGVEVVSEYLYPGSDAARIRPVKISGEERIAIYPVEDVIADRLRQYAEDGRAEMLEQAIALYNLADALDEAYLANRICAQTSGEWSFVRLKEEAG